MTSNINQEAKVIGLTGGIGSGKSTVGGFIAEMGYKVISMDDMAKELMNTNADLKQKLIAKFGDIIFQDNILNKKFLADYIFNSGADNKSNQESVNKIVHPFTIDAMIAEVEKLINAGEQMIFVESALIFETGLFDGYDYVVSVFTPKEVAIQRVMARNSMTREAALSIMALQMSPEEKVKYADFTIENKNNLQDLKNTTTFIVNLLATLPNKTFDEVEQ